MYKIFQSIKFIIWLLILRCTLNASILQNIFILLCGVYICIGENKNMLFMSIEWDCVSELRPPAGLLFIPQVMYEHGESWWSDINSGKLSIRPSELAVNPTNSHLVANQKELTKWLILPYEISISYFGVFFNIILRHEADGFTSLQRRRAAELCRPVSIALVRVWTGEPWIQWQVR
jgi:hypothetical protein